MLGSHVCTGRIQIRATKKKDAREVNEREMKKGARRQNLNVAQIKKLESIQGEAMVKNGRSGSDDPLCGKHVPARAPRYILIL
jgi:hypothetical protein